jgi:hypothetical protein
MELGRGDGLEQRSGEDVWQAQREGRPSARAVDRAAAAVCLCDRVDDRESESDAAVGAGAGDVCAGETLEDSVERVFGDAAAFVCHFDHDADSRGVSKI